MFSEDDYEGFAFLKHDTCNMNDKARIPDSWILLDSQSTVDMFKNKKLLKISLMQRRLNGTKNIRHNSPKTIWKHTRGAILPEPTHRLKNWIEMPIPNNVVDTIHRLSAATKQARGVTFTGRNGNITTYNDDEDEKKTQRMNQ